MIGGGLHVYITLVALLLSRAYVHALAVPADLETREAGSKYCTTSGSASICFAEFSSSPSNPTFRLAVPDKSAAPFDTLLQIIAPVSLGWAGFAWGGGMIGDPLTLGWPNGNKVTVSSRWATDRTVPAAYRGATYTTLSSSKNATHWSLEVVCSGCSSWSGGKLSTTDINTFAWAVSKNAVSQPASNASSFSIHTNVGMFTVDPGVAKVSQSSFDQYVAAQKAAPKLA
ncbi:cellobiose dehydrogenase [Diplogelasinospora grovesii]|uniref:Cellobiose dehydrogenase n=1 Tax=Diplogelasinospora grovesii TaxID=303347 RepID=A0AAN6MXH5_9PEZI|nr:cellobiose dehydrogenase [Diplogelasinospora grovesii]